MSNLLWRFYRTATNFTRKFLGPPALGVGHPEQPAALHPEARCAECGELFTAHRFEHTDNAKEPTLMHCPVASEPRSAW